MLGEHLSAGEVELPLHSGIFVAIAAVYGVLPDAAGVLGADGTDLGFGGISGPDERAEVGYGIFLFQDGGYDGSAAHELHQLVVKGTAPVDGIKLSGLIGAELGVLERDDPEARRVDLGKDSPEMAVAYGIGLDHGEGTIGGHAGGGNLVRAAKVGSFGHPGIFSDLCAFVVFSPMLQPIEAARRLLATRQDIVIFSHRNPDGDAVGSSLGLLHYLRGRGHGVTILLPSGYPEFLGFLPDVQQILIYDDQPELAERCIDAATLFFLLDFNSFDRVDKMAERMSGDDRPRIMIDHHLHPEPIANPIFSRPERSSTCEMVFEFIDELGDAALVDCTISDCLYTGILTDTGGFKYSTSPLLFRTVARLLEAGTDAYKVADHVWNNMSEKQLRLLGHCLANRMELLPEFRTGLIYLTKEDYEHFDIQRGDTEGVVNYILRMPEIMVAAFIHEQPTIVKLSLRSKGSMDVQQICKALFRGGGHRNAAGGASFAPLGSTINRFKKALPRYAAEIEASYHEFNNQ